MNKKEVVLLTETEALECLLHRLPEEHSYRKFFEVELHRSKSGKRGEARMKRKFNEFYSPEEHYVIWNVSLAIGGWRVQMDGLLLTERCALIIESKNISGRIHFDEATGEFCRFNDDDEKTIMEDPVIQLNKHMRFLGAWFKIRNINMPIDGLVVFTPKQCEFVSKPKDKYICKTYQMVEYLHTILQNYPQKVPTHKLLSIKNEIDNNQVPYQRIPLCEQYRLDWRELKRGVLCNKCIMYSMERKNHSWKCTKCGEKDSHAHAYAISEYFSLIDSSISNRQFRAFCLIESQSVATRLITALNLKGSGELKGRKYRLRNGADTP
jgi:hypothetical protein